MSEQENILRREVEELRRRVAELEAQQEMLVPVTSVLDALHVPVLLKDTNLRWKYANDALCDMLGYTRDQLMDITDFDVHTREEADMVTQCDRRVLESGHPSSYERTMLLNGDYYHLTTLKMLWDHPLSGERFIVSVVRDLTAVRQAEEALAETRERFGAVIRHSPVGIQMFRLTEKNELLLMDANPAADRILGFDSRDALGIPMEQAFPGLRDTEIPERFRAVAATGESWLHHHFSCDDDIISGIYDVYAFQLTPGLMAVLFQDVSEQIRVRETVEASELRYRSLFENSPISLLEEDFSGVREHLERIRALGVDDYESYFRAHPEEVRACTTAIRPMRVNGACMKMLGVFSKEEITENLQQFFTEESYEMFVRELAALARGETSYPLQGVYRTLQGEHRQFIGSLNIIPGCEESMEQVLISAMDVTERHRAELALQESEEQLRLALGATQDGLWDWDVRTGRCQFSPTFYSMVGYEPGDFPASQEGWRTLLHPEDLPLVERETVETFKSGEPFRQEFRLRRKDGDWHWVMSRGRVVDFDEDGNATRMVGAHTDINELKKTQEALVEYRNLVEAMSDNMIDMLWAKDLDGNYRFSNRANYETLLCGDGVDAIGHNHLFFANRLREQGFTYTFGEKCVDSDAVVLQDMAPGRFIEDGMVKDRYMVLDVRKSPLYDSSGALIGTVGMGRDITEQKKAGEALVRAKEAAEAAAKSKDQFLANMSHEIRTPMNGVLGMLQLLRGTTLDSEQKEYVDTCLESGRGLLSVINDILDFSKLDAGTFELACREFTLRETVRTVLHSFSVQARDKRIGLGYEIDPRLPAQLAGDDARLRQVLFNVVGNAVKFTHSGSVRVQADLLRREGSELLVGFEIADTGIGIPERMLDDIFEPFTQADGSYTREYHGTGLGLGIVRQLVHRMGGTISVESREGEGTTFYLTIRCLCCLPGEQGAAGCQECAKPGITLLLAEDDEVNRFTIKRYLEKNGYRVFAAEDGQQALDLFREHEFQCILMDIQMPGVDGLDATAAIREQEQRENRTPVPIIALTAHAMQGDRERFLEAGMDEYLSKPLELDALMEAIEAILS
ncbi:PAS domain-containing hybrid sensor histidine kinase/response regulator [Salidesulfovibrio onnuriiensis]|uniref:PAS domain-containing hybrid sensor histidine kinase/response regulator n=1 Tax=Salidesulfovibrio onnuriiensis TaxID=2583823 RepID=UPI0011C7F222|nr:PAS domain S-box protein [Salidesulfovibrio onnuriiensis]